MVRRVDNTEFCLHRTDPCRGEAGNALTIDVEDWFHILDSPTVPPIDAWASMESRVQRNIERLLTLLAQTDTRATFFWLGWAAERHVELVRRCQAAGHEIASHGYGHVLAYEVGSDTFQQDVQRTKALLDPRVSRRRLWDQEPRAVGVRRDSCGGA